MRRAIPEFNTKKEKFDYLVSNKKTLIKEKKSLPIKSDPFFGAVVKGQKSEVIKADHEDNDKVTVDVIANMSNFFDSHGDVSLPNSWNKSISERILIYHLKNHDHTTDGIVGDVLKMHNQDIVLKTIGIDSDVKTSQALMMKSEVKREYDEKTFELYKNLAIKQHSIGLQYVQIDLAVNDEDFEEEFKLYKSLFPQIINKSDVEEAGFFWAIKEQKIFEVSSVLFGSNSATPTISTEGADKNHPIEPSIDTQKNSGIKSILLLN